jgi:acetoin utilization deacetylase AcuC-like enzyme
MRTGIVTDQSFLAHETGSGHPERADRLRAIGRWLDANPAPARVPLEARDATLQELVRVHSPQHVEAVEVSAHFPRYAFDADTPVSPGSYAAARRAAGAVLTLVDEVMKGGIDNGFAFVRPPGHHAERDRAMGFCLFNNVAVAAAHLREAHGLERVLVVDWDVHHGNGTQHAFYADPRVLFVSSHQYPFYPGTGAAREVGAGEGEGFTLNLPFPAGYGDAQYVQAFVDVVEPVARRFLPQFVLVSAGFDAHRRDPLAGMDVTEGGFAQLARLLLQVARDICGNRLVAVLEGGYDPEALTRSVAAVLREMSGGGLGEAVTPPAGESADVRLPLEIARHYWRI